MNISDWDKEVVDGVEIETIETAGCYGQCQSFLDCGCSNCEQCLDRYDDHCA